MIKAGPGPCGPGPDESVFFVQVSKKLPNERFMKAFFAYFLSRKKVGRKKVGYILEGAETPMRSRQLAMTERTESASLSRAWRTGISSPRI